MKNKKKPLIIALACVLAVALIAAGVWFFWLKDYLSVSNSSPVYVTSVATILGMDDGATPRYSGVVEPQQTFQVEKDETKTVSEVLVSVGDEVHPGDILFRYDTEQLQFDLREAELAQEGIANQISTFKSQITSLRAEQKKASKDDQFSYTIEIQSLEVQIKQQEYESSLKKSEIDKLKESLENTDVLCEVDGVVKEVNTTPKTDPSGQQASFISILSSGEYRIKGTVSELNLGSLSEGQAVTVHSRLNAEQTWKGTVETIDKEPAGDQNGSAMFYPGMDSGEQSSKYHFYVVLEHLDGLILGQHVYIEPDQGEQTKKAGLWLPAVYVAHDESGSFVWAQNDKEKLEKRVVTLGEYDADTDTYEIQDGVTEWDFIAYPNDSLKPGMPTTIDMAYQDTYPDGTDIGGGDVSNVDGSMNGFVPEGEIPMGENSVDSPESYADSYSSGVFDDSAAVLPENDLEMSPPTVDEGGTVE